MALPKITTPEYLITLPILEQEIKIRPFLVKEEKILLMAMESGVEKEVVNAIKQIVNECTFNQVDIDSLPAVDLEYIFLELRKKSKGEVADIGFRCQHVLEDGSKCNTLNEVKVDLDTVEVVNKEVDTIVSLTDTVSVVMHQPTTDMALQLSEIGGESVDEMLNGIAMFIDKIIDGDEVHLAKDSTPEELVEFVGSLSGEQFKKMENYFHSLPSLETKVKFKCKSCGYEEEVAIKGISNFFA